MENEAWKEEYRKRAEERIKAVEAAQARIDALIARAGGPVMVVRNTQESEKEKHDDTIQALFDIADYKNGGDLTVWIRELTDTIDRLEAALHNVINERDQLMKDMKKLVFWHGDCFACKHLTDGLIECCVHCYPKDNRSQWEWRGVQEGENDGSTN